LLLTTHYDLRPARASLLLLLHGRQGGMTIQQIARWLGHSPEVLMATYAHRVVGDAERGARGT
jgi:CRP-like cAMP-binding protein